MKIRPNRTPGDVRKRYPALLTAVQVADVLGLHPVTVRKMLRDDNAPFSTVELNGRRYVRNETMARFLEGRDETGAIPD